MARSKKGEFEETGSRGNSKAKEEATVPTTERFLLMSLSPDGGAPAALPYMGHDIGFAGAILIDLMLHRRIRFHHGRVALLDRTPTGHAFLDKALQKFHSTRNALTISKWLELLAEDSTNLKQAAFERLADRSLVALKRRALVNGFEAHFFPHTKNGAQQSVVARIGRSESLDEADVLAVCVAKACGLFDVILSKKHAKRLDKQIQHLVVTNVVGEEVIETVETTSQVSGFHFQRSVPTTTGKKPQANKKADKWEWRAFWFGQPLVIRPCYTVGFDAAIKFKTSKVFDCYLLIPERGDNIKVREHGLEVKELIKSHLQYEAFRPKEVLKFPIEATDLARVFPRVSGGLDKVSDELELKETLRAHGYALTHVNVEKIRNRVRLGDDVRLEFCKFTVKHRSYWSACIEGPDFSRVRTCVHSINPQAGRVMGYTAFLHRMVGKQ